MLKFLADDKMLINKNLDKLNNEVKSINIILTLRKILAKLNLKLKVLLSKLSFP